MHNPFPGMDPYLEQHWGDVHHRLVQYASDQLQEHLPADLRRGSRNVSSLTCRATSRLFTPTSALSSAAT